MVMREVYRLVWEIQGERFVSPLAWEIATDATSAARQAELAMKNAGLQNEVRFIGLEISVRKAVP
jgi:hypothetical protein